jgi:mono/diheme cytochrome c family protein
MTRIATFLPLVALLAGAAATAAADDGGQMYGKKCLACHGLDGAGDKPLGKKVGVPDLRKSTLSQAEMERIIADGKGKMLPYREKLTPEQIAAIAAHVKSALVMPGARAGAPAAPAAKP